MKRKGGERKYVKKRINLIFIVWLDLDMKFIYFFFFLISSPLFSLYFFKPKITRNSSSCTILLLFIFYHRNILTNFG